jgi:hypothetical protein
MTQNIPRKHHIVPAFHLAGFTRTGTIDGQLHVFDYLHAARHYSARPRNVCKEQDYFRVYEPDVDPFIVERDMALLEQDYAKVLHEIRVKGRLFRPEHARIALELASFIQARTRRSRHQLTVALRKTIHHKLLNGKAFVLRSSVQVLIRI